MCWVPHLQLASLMGSQVAFEEKFGGIPWGLPTELWPICRECGEPQSLLAQLRHHPQRLDLGAAGRVLMLFQCQQHLGMCRTWESDLGANACLVLPEHALSDALAVPPTLEVPGVAEARVLGWEKKPQSDREDPFFTCLGGTPNFFHPPQEELDDDWQFVGQIESIYYFPMPMPTAEEAGCDVITYDARTMRRAEPSRYHPSAPACICSDTAEPHVWYVEGPAFGEYGLGYIYLRQAGEGVEGRFFSQSI